MLSIGPLEMAVIALITLLVVGPQKLPEVARQFGRFFIQAKRATSDIRSQVDEFMRETEASVIKEEHDKLRQLISSEVSQVRDSTKKAIDQATNLGVDDDDFEAESGYEEKPHYDPELEAADLEAEQAARKALENQVEERNQAVPDYEPSLDKKPSWETETEKKDENETPDKN